MRLLIELGYNKILFAKDAQVGLIIDCLNKAVLCEEEGPYNARKLVKASSVEIQVKLIISAFDKTMLKHCDRQISYVIFEVRGTD